MNLKHVALVFVGLAVGLTLGTGWQHMNGREPPLPTPHDPEHACEANGQPTADEDIHELTELMQGHADEYDHGDHEADDGHDDHEVVHVSPAAMSEFELALAVAEPGFLDTEIERPGKVVLNDSRVAHIVPRAPGIVRVVAKSVGDRVAAGEVLAWIESAELGQAKADYLAKWAEVGCCKLDLTRARQIHDNTLKLLETLEHSPPPDTLQNLGQAVTGEHGRLLISAYAELELARAEYRRERELIGKGVSSEKDVQAAEGAHRKAAADYAAARDGAQFAVRRDLLEARRAQQVRQIELKSAERTLHVLGLDTDEIRGLEQLAEADKRRATARHACTDPNCQDCAAAGHTSATGGATGDDDEKLAWYALRAPFAGAVIEKHITLGERLADDANLFTIADLSSVWVDVSVYQSDLTRVREGGKVVMSAGPGALEAEGVIAFVAPLVGEATRTTYARIVLPNPDGRWMPGLYVTARIAADRRGVGVLIPKHALQTIDARSVVFVPGGDGFEPRPVEVGQSTAEHAEIIAGLAPGERYVSGGAFTLKAEIVTSGLGSHAGHGH